MRLVSKMYTFLVSLYYFIANFTPFENIANGTIKCLLSFCVNIMTVIVETSNEKTFYITSQYRSAKPSSHYQFKNKQQTINLSKLTSCHVYTILTVHASCVVCVYKPLTVCLFISFSFYFLNFWLLMNTNL